MAASPSSSSELTVPRTELVNRAFYSTLTGLTPEDLRRCPHGCTLRRTQLGIYVVDHVRRIAYPLMAAPPDDTRWPAGAQRPASHVGTVLAESEAAVKVRRQAGEITRLLAELESYKHAPPRYGAQSGRSARDSPDRVALSQSALATHPLPLPTSAEKIPEARGATSDAVAPAPTARAAGKVADAVARGPPSVTSKEKKRARMVVYGDERIGVASDSSSSSSSLSSASSSASYSSVSTRSVSSASSRSRSRGARQRRRGRDPSRSPDTGSSSSSSNSGSGTSAPARHRKRQRRRAVSREAMERRDVDVDDADRARRQSYRSDATRRAVAAGEDEDEGSTREMVKGTAAVVRESVRDSSSAPPWVEDKQGALATAPETEETAPRGSPPPAAAPPEPVKSRAALPMHLLAGPHNRSAVLYCHLCKVFLAPHPIPLQQHIASAGHQRICEQIDKYIARKTSVVPSAAATAAKTQDATDERAERTRSGRDTLGRRVALVAMGGHVNGRHTTSRTQFGKVVQEMPPFLVPRSIAGTADIAAVQKDGNGFFDEGFDLVISTCATCNEPVTTQSYKAHERTLAHKTNSLKS